MAVQLSDLDDLVQKVRNRHVKNYFYEAVVAYRAGAYRAAVISTWISICIDVIEKVKELSVDNDTSAKAIEKKLTAINSNDYASMLGFEKDILRFACDDLELISHIEKSHLERIKDDRNVCAHPTFSIDGHQFTPSPELTRAYIVQAATYLLTKSPVRGKVVVENMFSLINEESFPSDEEKAFTVLSSTKYLGRVRDSSARNLIIILLKRIFKDENDLDSEMLQKLSAALGAISRLFPELYRETLRDKLPSMLAAANDKLLRRVIPFLNSRTEAWESIERATVVRIEECITAMDFEGLLFYGVPELASKISLINDKFQVIIGADGFSNTYELLKSAPNISLKDQALKYFCDSGSFNSAYTNGINILIPYAQFITDKDLEQLFEGILANKTWNINQILNAGGIEEVLCTLYKKSKGNVVSHARLWIKFVDELASNHFVFEQLNELLVADKLIDQKEEDG
ncbi:hypothetical protein DRB05_08125 [Pseudoalteromonas sp. A757]|nr:hypothetical protein DRB05_08125 [Pseudoalteromonas sp. A757]